MAPFILLRFNFQYNLTDSFFLPCFNARRITLIFYSYIVLIHHHYYMVHIVLTVYLRTTRLSHQEYILSLHTLFVQNHTHNAALHLM